MPSPSSSSSSSSSLSSISVVWWTFVVILIVSLQQDVTTFRKLPIYSYHDVNDDANQHEQQQQQQQQQHQMYGEPFDSTAGFNATLEVIRNESSIEEQPQQQEPPLRIDEVQNHHQRSPSSSPSPSYDLSSIKYLLFITTAFSTNHTRFFDCCWPLLVERSEFIRNAHIIIFANNNTELVDDDPTIVDRLHDLFQYNPSFQIHFESFEPHGNVDWNDYQRNPLQVGANLGLQKGYQKGWFRPYDWLIRVNPDVLLRDSTFLQRDMVDPNIHGIFMNCLVSLQPNRKKIHTDWFAVRPYSNLIMSLPSPSDSNNTNNNTSGGGVAVDTGRGIEHVTDYPFYNIWRNGEKGFMNHEFTATKYFRPIFKAKKVRWMDTDPTLRIAPSNGWCRIRGTHSPVIHQHMAINKCSFQFDGWMTPSTTPTKKQLQLVTARGKYKRGCATLAGWDIK